MAEKNPNPSPMVPPAASKWYDSTLLTIALLIFLWPVGVFALLKNRKLGGFGKFVIGGGITFGWLLFFGGAAFGGYYLYTHPELAEKYVPGFKSNSTDPLIAVSDPNQPANPVTTTAPVEVEVDGSTSAQNTPPIDSSAPKAPDAPKVPEAPKAPDAPKVDEAAQEAARQAKKLEEAKAKDAQELAERERVEREKAEIAKKNSAALAEKEAADFNRRKQEDAARLETASANVRKQADAISAKRKSQIFELEKALEDYNAAALLVPHLQSMEDAFKQYLKETTKSTKFSDEQFNAFFTPDYLKNYNSQLTRQQQGILDYIKILRAEITKSDAAMAKVTTDVEAANRANAAAGLPKIELPAANPELEKRLANVNEATAMLRERVVTLVDIREKLGVSTVATKNPPIADPTPPNPLPPADPVPIAKPPVEPFVQPSKQPAIEPLVVPPAISTADIQGNWVRGDGKVTWGFEAGGILVVRDKKPVRGTWSFDEKTSVLSAQHSGAPFRFVVSKERDQLTATGGPSGNTSMRFNKK